jgi:hypothetical protein
MAKKFMFVCIGILALTITFLLGAQFGRAEYVDHSTTGIVSAYGPIEWGVVHVLTDNGQAWRCDQLGNWQPDGSSPCLPPIPPSQIKFWGYQWVVSENNDVWTWNSGANTWANAGPPPGGVATQPSTWGSIKAQFGK